MGSQRASAREYLDWLRMKTQEEYYKIKTNMTTETLRIYATNVRVKPIITIRGKPI